MLSPSLRRCPLSNDKMQEGPELHDPGSNIPAEGIPKKLRGRGVANS